MINLQHIAKVIELRLEANKKNSTVRAMYLPDDDKEIKAAAEMVAAKQVSRNNARWMKLEGLLTRPELDLYMVSYFVRAEEERQGR